MKVTASILASPRTAPLLSGEVAPEGVEFEANLAESVNNNTRAMLDGQFDMAEVSVVTFLKAVSQGYPLALLPVFPSGRQFVQGGVHVSQYSALMDMADLAGRNVAVPQYWMSSSVWHRIALKQLHGLEPSDMSWVTLQAERLKDSDAPPGVELRRDTSGRTAVELMAAGEIDAVLSPIRGGGAGVMSTVAMPGYSDLPAAERLYFTTTGILPLMHVTVISRELADGSPETVLALIEAYQRAKELAASATSHNGTGPGEGGGDERLRQLVGDDPFQYAIAPNRSALETVIASVADEGLVPERLRIEDLLPKDLPEQYR